MPSRLVSPTTTYISQLSFIIAECICTHILSTTIVLATVVPTIIITLVVILVTAPSRHFFIHQVASGSSDQLPKTAAHLDPPFQYTLGRTPIKLEQQ
jgi:hypothetical protein